MRSSAADRDRLGGWTRTIGTNLLFVLLVLLIARPLLGVTAPLDVDVLAILVAGTCLAWQLLDPSPSDERPDAGPRISPRQTSIALAGLVVIGAGLRLYALGSQGFWFDEAITTNAAIGILDGGRPTFPSGVDYWRGLPHTVLVAASMAVFGVSEWAARVPSVLFGVLTIPVVYLLGREVGGRRLGLIAATVVTVLTWEVTWSRQARMYQQLQFFYALTLVGLARVDRTGLDDRVTVALIGSGAVLAALSHKIGLVLFPVSIAVLAVHQWSARDALRPRDFAVVVAVVAAAAAIELTGVGPLAVSRTVLATEIDYVDAYLAWTRSEFGVLYYLAVVGVGLSFRNRTHGLLLALSVVPPLWVLLFHTKLFAVRYLYFAVPVLVVYAALAVEFGTDRTATFLRRWDAPVVAANPPWGEATRRHLASVAVTVVPVAVTLLLVAPALTVVPQEAYALGPNTPQPDFESAYGYVDEHGADGDVLVAGWTAPAAYYNGDVDYWLAHDLSGIDNDWTTEDGREYYTGAVPLSGPADLRAVVDCHDRGWVVVDRVVYQRIQSGSRAVLANLTLHDAGADGIRVFSWVGTGGCTGSPTDPAEQATSMVDEEGDGATGTGAEPRVGTEVAGARDRRSPRSVPPRPRRRSPA